jgi:hypothetical protein
MSFDRTPAECRADEASRQLRTFLDGLPALPTRSQLAKLGELREASEHAWRVVHEMRQGRR